MTLFNLKISNDLLVTIETFEYKLNVSIKKKLKLPLFLIFNDRKYNFYNTN